MSTHNLCFEAKIGMPLHTPFLLYKSGVQGGIYYTDMLSRCNFAMKCIFALCLLMFSYMCVA